MATYTVIQDIEAEDKLLGPLSLRQFIYAIIVVILLFVMFKLATLQPLLILPFLPPTILFAVLAAPFGHDQSSEIWLLAKIRFFLKPHLRVWNQSGLQELVSINVPKRIEEHLTNGLDENQVQSRLSALAQTIDTRGWAVKGVDVNLYTNPAYANQDSDRLLSPSTLSPQRPVSDLDLRADDDVLDIQNTAVAQHMNQLVQANDSAHRQAVIQRMEQARQDPTSLPPPVGANNLPSTLPEPVLPTLARTQNAYGQTPVLQPDLPTRAPAQPIAAPTTPAPVTQPVNPAILGLASNDDLSVATLARQAQKSTELGSDEVVISLR